MMLDHWGEIVFAAKLDEFWHGPPTWRSFFAKVQETSIKATGLVDALAIYVLYKFAMLDVIECNASGLGLPRQGMDDEPKAHCCAGGAAGLVGLAFVHALLANQRLIDHLLRLRNKCFR
jgi:hypothetical protein